MPLNKLILSEGAGDEAFFRQLIKVRNLQNFEVYNRPQGKKLPDGEGAFEWMLKSVAPGSKYAHCELIVIVGDNDSDPDKKFRNIVRQIKNARRFAVPDQPLVVATKDQHFSVSVLMLPWVGVPGDLETLCFELAVNKRQNLKECVKRYVECVGAEDWSISQLSKLQLRCLMSVRCRKDPNTPLQFAWTDGGKKRPKDLIPLRYNHYYLKNIVKYLKNLP